MRHTTDSEFSNAAASVLHNIQGAIDVTETAKQFVSITGIRNASRDHLENALLGMMETADHYWKAARAAQKRAHQTAPHLTDDANRAAGRLDATVEKTRDTLKRAWARIIERSGVDTAR